jgi:hypothetical protein
MLFSSVESHLALIQTVGNNSKSAQTVRLTEFVAIRSLETVQADLSQAFEEAVLRVREDAHSGLMRRAVPDKTHLLVGTSSLSILMSGVKTIVGPR